MAKETLTITDNRTGRRHEIPIEHGAIRAADLRPLGLVSYDPAFANTASCTSRITYVDGDAGVLLYRGYPIEQLAEQSTFLETAYLLIKGELPTPDHLAQWTHNIIMHTIVHENVKQFMDGFRYDAHPMGMLVATVGALSTFYPDAPRIHDPESRRVQTHRLLAKMPTIAAFAHRHALGQPYVYPDNDLSYPGNFLSMMFKMTELEYRPDPVLERALDVLLLLDVAPELVRIALEDDYFVARRLYPNVDFYSGIIYQAMGFPVDMFPVLFAIARTAGWIAQWLEMVQDEEQTIARPRQLYLGRARRDYVPLVARAAAAA